MRISVAAISLAATLAGCNQVYGLDETRVGDPMLPPGTVRVSSRHVATASTGHATAPTNAPLDDLDAVHYGPLGEPLEGTPRELDGATAEIEIPGDVFRVPWRFVLLRTNQVPHEYQFASSLEAMHVIVPRYSRTERRALPDTDQGRVLAVQPTGYSTMQQAAHEHHRVYSTGVWSATPVDVNGQFQLFFDCPSTMSCVLPTFLDGAGVPEAGRGDRYLAVALDNVDVEGTCRRSVGAADFTVELADVVSTSPEPQPPWLASRKSVANLVTTDAFFTSIAALPGDDGPFRYHYGYVPTDALSAFGLGPPPDFALPGIPMLSLVECGRGANPPEFIHSEDLDVRFPLVARAEITRVQTRANAPTLVNGLAVFLPTNNGNAVMEELAPVVTNLRIGDTAAVNGDVRVPVARAQLHTLTFDGGASADYYDVLLHEIVGTQLQLRRVFTLPSPASAMTIPVDLHAINLATDAEYVFEIRAYTGREAARTGDFEQASTRQSMAVVHSATFVVAD